MKKAALALALFKVGIATAVSVMVGALAIADDSSFSRVMAPTGTLRVAIGVGPAQSEFWATRDGASGDFHGVTVDLGKLAAARLGLPLQLVPYANSGEIAAAATKDTWDLSFMPADAERAKIIDQGPPYVVYISAYLLRPGSDIINFADVDTVGHHVGCITGTSTARTVANTLKKASLTCYTSAEEGATMLRNGKIDALAMGRGAASNLERTMPGSRLLNEPVQTTNVVVVVPKDHAEAAAWAASFVEAAKADGTMRHVLDASGFVHAEVAPPTH